MSNISEDKSPRNTDISTNVAFQSDFNSSSTQEQFIFRESEFDGESFDPAAFVAKYRRVTSLESLRQQLHACTEGFKQQLYIIINRDYKDFINIATKLDGVDDRIEFLRKPLVDLRLDLAALHDGLLASVQSIQDKLQRKAEISSRRLLLETILACTEKLDIVESVIYEARDGKPSDISHSKTMTRRQLLGLVDSSTAKKTLFICSELERASYGIKHVDELLDKINLSVSVSDASHRHPSFSGSIVNTNVNTISSNTPINSNNSNNPMLLVNGINAGRTRELETLQKTLRHRSNHLLNALASEIQRRVSSMISSHGTNMETFPTATFTHCIRALLVIERGDALESAIDQVIVTPLAKSMLTQGRVDGTGGRGSYSGLQETLLELLRQLSDTLKQPIRIVEEQVSTWPIVTVVSKIEDYVNPTIDVVIRGIWKPIATILIDRFPSMFTIAIADNFSRCFMAYDLFKASLSKIAGEEWHHHLLHRMENSTMVSDIDGKWHIDVYFHLRSQEICSNIDKVCELSYISGVTTNVFEKSIHATQTMRVELQEKLSIGSYHLSLLKYFAIEISVCLDHRIMLRPMHGRFLSLVFRLLQRLEAHICLVSEITSHRFNKSMLLTLQNQMIPTSVESSHTSTTTNITTTTTTTSTTTATISTIQSTPMKGSHSNGNTPTTPLSANSSSNSLLSTVTPATTGISPIKAPVIVASVMTIDELVMLFIDISHFQSWLQSNYLSYARNQTNPRILMLSEQLERILSSQAQAFLSISSSLWNKACGIIAGECKRNLGGVRVIEGKYRMTNKPPPDSPSTYVETILQPLRVFRDRHGKEVKPILSSSEATMKWDLDLVEDVTIYFYQQVQSLMETVKQRDTALQRRTKARHVSSTSGAGGVSSTSGIPTTMTDSEKISLQVSLDVTAYGQEISSTLSVDPNVIASYVSLVALVAEEAKAAAAAAAASASTNA